MILIDSIANGVNIVLNKSTLFEVHVYFQAEALSDLTRS
ncbi:hypothetical protein N42HA_01595 [Lactococcus lactis]|uniref:Uncharacterized protein n=1 Tax=Lactococcus lactis subsp. lactis TaxID=1360 RepID=A0A0V8ELK6_LACLL|nr:hypothetical protein N42_1522 [Lactococcus lactis subsp. lactis]MDU0408580.1 hypothetical protein [Lactococcus lactis]